MDFYLHIRAERTRRTAPSAFPGSPSVPPLGCGRRTRELSARGAWAAPAVKNPALGLSSGLHLRVLSSNSALGSSFLKRKN